MSIRISKEQARRFLIHYHYLDQDTLTGTSGILKYMDRVRCIQYDPLNVVGQNQDLILQSRISDYRPHLLRELLYSDYQLIDQWDKNMSICLSEDWPYFSRFRGKYIEWCNQHRDITDAIVKRITTQGTCCSSDFEFEEKVDWHYGETRMARAALEGMYYAGELVIHHKIHTRKYYDLAERHIPQDILHAQEPNIAEKDFFDWFVLRRLDCIGMLWNRPSDAWLGVQPFIGSGFKSKERNEAFGRLLTDHRIAEVEIEDMLYPLYIRTENLPMLEAITKFDAQNTPFLRILAPLDNMLWDRNLIKELFDFEYRWEVYKPAADRQYGYYVLPVLYGDQLVARFEPEKHHQNGKSVIKNWWWEKELQLNSSLEHEVREGMKRFTEYLNI